MRCLKIPALIVGMLFAFPNLASACTMQEAMDKMNAFSQALIATNDQAKISDYMVKSQSTMATNTDAKGKVNYDKICGAYDDLLKEVASLPPPDAPPPAKNDACIAKFNAINKIDAKAGPFEIDTDTSIKIPTQSAEIKVTTVTQIVPPKSFHVRIVSAQGETEAASVDGAKAWVKHGGDWVDVPQDNLSDVLALAPTDTYLRASGLDNVVCNGRQVVNRKAYLSFTYTITAQGVPMQVTSYFDPRNRLPIKGEGAADAAGTKTTVTMTYKFDPTIKVDAPVVQ
ncbi:hypothetical protein [Methylovirgula sp. 4M-Z18]|uniref:hypothetical protein n=1 Tax=Methylovirgula sp. 4M-Z18 TaxID=2293567 RepID=UPI000E2F5809|nr:hypothetical protein [Methylovirgula sp. 4M-Z18]RFB78940.1 hypothetical protein DYH55_14005 [Methylovirgula sp. 4M-Z18]